MISNFIYGFRFRAAVFLLLASNATAQERVTVTGLFPDRAILDVDGKLRVVLVGATSPEGVKVISIAGGEAVLEIHGQVRSFPLGMRISGTYAPPAPGATVTIAPDAQGMYQTSGSINGFQVQFVVDTGATLVSMNRQVAKRIGLDYRMDGTPSRSSTAAGVVPVWLVALDRVRLGDIELRDVQASVHDADFPEEVLLGNSFLQRLNMVREGRLLRLTRP